MRRSELRPCDDCDECDSSDFTTRPRTCDLRRFPCDFRTRVRRLRGLFKRKVRCNDRCERCERVAVPDSSRSVGAGRGTLACNAGDDRSAILTLGSLEIVYSPTTSRLATGLAGRFKRVLDFGPVDRTRSRLIASERGC
jgi:hypothetical protein